MRRLFNFFKRKKDNVEVREQEVKPTPIEKRRPKTRRVRFKPVKITNPHYAKVPAIDKTYRHKQKK